MLQLRMLKDIWQAIVKFKHDATMIVLVASIAFVAFHLDEKLDQFERDKGDIIDQIKENTSAMDQRVGRLESLVYNFVLSSTRKDNKNLAVTRKIELSSQDVQNLQAIADKDEVLRQPDSGFSKPLRHFSSTSSEPK